MKKYGYIRVSSKDQNPKRQVEAIVASGVDKRYIHVDKISGKNFNRPQYQQMIKNFKQGDLVVIKSIDRLGRNYEEILEQWRILTKEIGVDIQVLDMPLLNTRTEIDGLTGVFIVDLVLQILAYLAETERTFIKQRQAEGIAIAKANGVHFGCKRIELAEDADTIFDLWRRGIITANEAATRLQISKSTFYRRCREKRLSKCRLYDTHDLYSIRVYFYRFLLIFAYKIRFFDTIIFTGKDDMENNVEKFNKEQKKALINLCDEIKDVNSEVKIYVLYWIEKDEDENYHIDEEGKEKHDFLNYYWGEFKKDGMEYKITMFYKDFDFGSGNIHVLPGAIQVWKKVSCWCSEEDDKGFCLNDLRKETFIKNGGGEYYMSGGKTYCEYGWKPLFDGALFWDDKNLESIITCIQNGMFKCVDYSIKSNKFYEGVKDYKLFGKPKEERLSRGNYMRYSLYRFSRSYLYYKTLYIKDKGYFTKYDGRCVEFVEAQNPNDGTKNEKGPNYYDLKQCKWIINDKQYGDTKEKNNE